MRGARARWAVALRIARRSAFTAWGRSLLIVALIAAPITGLSAAAVLLPSTQPTTEEELQNTLGSTQARLQVVGSPKSGVKQNSLSPYSYDLSNPDAGSDSTRVDPRTALPSAARVLTIGTGAATFAQGAGAISLAVTTGPTWDAALQGGPYALLSGRAPAATDEVLLSPAALKRLNAKVGGTITMTTPSRRTLTVVGTARDRGLPTAAQDVFAAAALLPDSTATLDSNAYYVVSAPVDLSTLQRLNAAGTTAYSRQLVLNPPPQLTSSLTGGPNASTIVTVILGLVFAILEVALLAGSAFLVGARLQQRMLATVASVGADRAVLRRVVTAGGVVLGAVGGVAGVGLGILGAIVVMRVTDNGAWNRYPGLHLIWPLLAGIALFGVVVGWLAALVPARAASRFDVVRALRGARTPQRVGKRPAVGAVLLTGGVVMTLAGGGALFAALQIRGDATAAMIGALVLLGGGPVVAQVGVLLCAGLVLRGVARLVGGISLPARLASRDTARNLGRAVPAVASVMTTVFIAAFVMCIGNTTSLQSATQYYWQAPDVGRAAGSIGTSNSSGVPTAAETTAWLQAIRRDLPVATAAVSAQTRETLGTGTPSDRTRDALPQVRFPSVPATCTPASRRIASDLRCGPFTANANGQSWVTVGDLATLEALLGHTPTDQAAATLAAGGAVALRSDLAPGGRATIDWFTPKQFTTGVTPETTPRKVTNLTAVVDLPVHPMPDSLFITAATAKTLGMSAVPFQVLLSFTRPPTQAELDSTNASLGALANSPGTSWVTVEQGPQDYGSQIAWWILLACLIIAISAGATAIGLARVDGRADDLTLASLGASPRIRRSVAFVQALIICGVGAVIGMVLGLLPAIALGAATASLPFAPPVLQLVLTALGIPAVIAIGSYLLVGRRAGDLTRRTAMA